VSAQLAQQRFQEKLETLFPLLIVASTCGRRRFLLFLTCFAWNLRRIQRAKQRKRERDKIAEGRQVKFHFTRSLSKVLQNAYKLARKESQSVSFKAVFQDERPVSPKFYHQASKLMAIVLLMFIFPWRTALLQESSCVCELQVIPTNWSTALTLMWLCRRGLMIRSHVNRQSSQEGCPLISTFVEILTRANCEVLCLKFGIFMEAAFRQKLKYTALI